MASEQLLMHQQFVHALQHEPIQCAKSGCAGPVEVQDLSQIRDRVKVFEARCQQCGWTARLSGREQTAPPWDDAAILVMADEHLMHQQPSCPFDGTPVVFTSLPNPRRRAKYRLSCYYCGRQVETDWPPAEARR